MEDGVYLEWAKSSSKDVTAHRVYRGVRGTTQWELVSIVDSLQFYLDTAVQSNQPHLYTVLAVDDAGLESSPAKPVRASRKASKLLIAYEGFSGRSERENKRIVLFWRVDDPGIVEIKVYRSVSDEPMSLYQTLPVVEQLVDEKVVQNTTYSYQLKAVLKNGTEANFSERVKVKY